MLPDGSLSIGVNDDKLIVIYLKNISLNLAAFPNVYIHALHACVTTEFRARSNTHSAT